MMIIAIDGFSGCGKSTLAQALARTYELPYIDTGAMYRAVTYVIIMQNIDIHDSSQLYSMLQNLHLHFERVDGENHIFLNGQDVERDIRSREVSARVSEVAAIPEVREMMVPLQRKLSGKGLVMDGRDIGTVVFPDADFKFFLTSDLDIRVQRRYKQLKEKGLEQPIEEVRQNLIHRDHLDSTRSHSPLKKADDAVTIDNTYLSFQELVDVVMRYIGQKRSGE